MLRFKTKDSLPATPKSWTFPNGHKESWNSATTLYESFLARLMAYADANNQPRPALDVLEDHLCRQMSSWACIDAAQYVARQSKPKDMQNPPAKKCCGQK